METFELRREIESGCHGKMRFRDRAYAKRKAEQVTAMYGHRNSIYRCKYCGDWHLTTHKWGRRHADG